MITKEQENIVVVPLCWLTRETRKDFIRVGYEVIPIPGYRETNGLRAFKIIGKYNDTFWLIKEFSIPIWEDWKLTAIYAHRVEISDTTTTSIQMFDHLDDDEKIQALKYGWYINTREYIVKYFREHPELLKRAKNSLKLEEIRSSLRIYL